MIMRWIYLKSSTCLCLKIIVDTDWCQEWKIKTSPCFPTRMFQLIRFKAQQRTKDRLLQLTANCIPVIRCLRHYSKLIWESPTTVVVENHQPLWQFVSILYKTNRINVAVRLFSNRSQKASNCGKIISDTLGYRLVCHFFVVCQQERNLFYFCEQVVYSHEIQEMTRQTNHSDWKNESTDSAPDTKSAEQRDENISR